MIYSSTQDIFSNIVIHEILRKRLGYDQSVEEYMQYCGTPDCEMWPDILENLEKNLTVKDGNAKIFSLISCQYLKATLGSLVLYPLLLRAVGWIFGSKLNWPF